MMLRAWFTTTRMIAAAAACAFAASAILVLVDDGGSDDAIFGATAAAATAPRHAKAEVMHFWVSGSEHDALAVFREAYVSEHGEDTWIDSPQPSHPELRRVLMDRLATGTPPVAVLWQSNIELRDLAELGLFSRLDDVAERQGWDAAFPAAIRARVQVDGHYYLAPTNVHGLNWIFYSRPLLQRLGIAEPRTWDDVIAAMHRVEASGARAVAMGPGDWEAQVAFASILAGTMGRENYRRLLAHRDPRVLDTPGALKAFEVFAAIRDISARHRPYENWDTAAQAVARGEAAFEFMGDWAKGEFIRAGATPGEEVGCMLAPGTENAVILTIDGFAFPASTSMANATARRALASTLLDPLIQSRFATVKDTVPARLDAQLDLDVCEQTLARLLSDPAAPIETPSAGLPSAQSGDYQIAITQFYRDPEMTPEAGLALLAAVFR